MGGETHPERLSYNILTKVKRKDNTYGYCKEGSGQEACKEVSFVVSSKPHPVGLKPSGCLLMHALCSI